MFLDCTKNVLKLALVKVHFFMDQSTPKRPKLLMCVVWQKVKQVQQQKEGVKNFHRALATLEFLINMQAIKINC